jgi:hypothetical protein
MTDYLMTGDRTNWSVLWIAQKGKKKVIIEHECHNDLTEALRVYMLAKEGGKTKATLLCKNTGFPPPQKYRPYDKTRVVKRKVKGKVKRVRLTRTVDPMVKVNDAGFTWCPYCREMRVFERVKLSRKRLVNGTHNGQQVEWVMPALDGVEYQCPMCGVSTSNHHVRKYNPGLVVVAKRTRTRRPNGRRSRR